MNLPLKIYTRVYQGNNKRTIFSNDEDYLIFFENDKRIYAPNAAIIADCLMPNHFYLLIHAEHRIERLIKQGGLLVVLLQTDLENFSVAMQEFLIPVIIKPFIMLAKNKKQDG